MNGEGKKEESSAMFDRFRNLLYQAIDDSKQRIAKHEQTVQEDIKKFMQSESLEIKRRLGLSVLIDQMIVKIESDRTMYLTFFEWLVDITDLQHRWMAALTTKLNEHHVLKAQLQTINKRTRKYEELFNRIIELERRREEEGKKIPLDIV